MYPFLKVFTGRIDNVTGEKVKKVRLAAHGDLEADGFGNVFSLAALFIIDMKALNAYVIR